MHRGLGLEPKAVHRTWLAAWWHLRGHQKHFKIDADKVRIYPCWFTAENTFGRKHYHIGHIKRSKRYDASAAKPRNGTLMWGVFAVEDGFEVRTFDVKPARCHPPRTTITEAVLEYLREPGEEEEAWTTSPSAPTLESCRSAITRGS